MTCVAVTPRLLEIADVDVVRVVAAQVACKERHRVVDLIVDAVRGLARPVPEDGRDRREVADSRHANRARRVESHAIEQRLDVRIASRDRSAGAVEHEVRDLVRIGKLTDLVFRFDIEVIDDDPKIVIRSKAL